mgnify:FL=1
MAPFPVRCLARFTAPARVPLCPPAQSCIPSALSLLSSCLLPCLFHGACASPGLPRYSPVFRVPRLACLQSASLPASRCLRVFLYVSLPRSCIPGGTLSLSAACRMCRCIFRCRERKRPQRPEYCRKLLSLQRFPEGGAQPGLSPGAPIFFIINPTNSR